MNNYPDGYHITRTHLGKTLRTIKIVDGDVWLVGSEKNGCWSQPFWLEANDYIGPCNCGHCKKFDSDNKCEYLKKHNLEILRETCPDFDTKIKSDFSC